MTNPVNTQHIVPREIADGIIEETRKVNLITKVSKVALIWTPISSIVLAGALAGIGYAEAIGKTVTANIIIGLFIYAYSAITNYHRKENLRSLRNMRFHYLRSR